jgi:nucleotide-binding universal stress UspA family protein
MSAHVQVPTPDLSTKSAVLREILFPTDLSPESAGAFEYARLLAERFHARVVLLHVMPAGPVAPGIKVPETTRRAARSARETLERWASDLGRRQCVIVEPADSVPGALLRCVRGGTPDLVVMATHGREGLAHAFLGSITESVTRHGRTPVLCVREPEHGAALPFRRILVPTDLSAASRRPFALGGTIARAFDSEVLALHVARVRDRPLVGMTTAVESALPSEPALRDFLWPQFAGTRIAARVELGSAADQIIQTARTEKADLIVMSTHGHDSLRDRVLGSQTERVIRTAPCPVLVT